MGVSVGSGNDLQSQFWLTAFRRRLQELGWLDGRDLQIDVRWGSADIDYIRSSAADLLSSKPDVILVYGVRALYPIRQATRQIPVVFIATSDPVGLGLVESLAHPGGNLTGFMLYEVSLAGKLVELLKELVPDLVRVALVFSPDNTSAPGYWRSIETVAKSRNVIPISLPVRDIGNILDAVDAFAREPNGGLVLPIDLTTIVNRDLIVALAARHRLPALYSFRSDVASGGLMSYGPDTTVFLFARPPTSTAFSKARRPPICQCRHRPSSIWYQPQTAKALGLEVPPTLLARADEVIE